VAEEKLKLAVFIDFDNIQIGVKDTLGKDFDVSVVLEALKERGEVVSKTAYGDWSRAGEPSRQMTQHAVQLVQRNLTPRGDKNGADINLALDALEMAFTRDHINAFVIVGGDSDFITLVEKLKQYDKRVFVVGGRQFTSGILQRNCHEFISYENLLKRGGDGPRAARATRASGRVPAESRPLSTALPNIQRALKILAEREVAPQLGLLKSTLLQLDPTFSERDFGAGSFLEFIQKLERAGLAHLRKTGRGYLVEAVEVEASKETPEEQPEAVSEPPALQEVAAEEIVPPKAAETATEAGLSPQESLELLRRAVGALAEKIPARPIYLRQVRQVIRSLDSRFDERHSGFRGLLDLLHQGQREGWLRLHRDRKGVWRVFPLSPAPSGAPVTEVTTEAGPAISAEPEVAEVEVVEEVTQEPEEVPELEEVSGEVPPPQVEEVAPAQEPAAPKARRPRRRTTGKTGRRKTSVRRKPPGDNA
jgi:uncharacterized LabA/DUF88 family protein